MIATIVIVLVVALALAAVIVRAVLNRKAGKNASCGCSACAERENCAGKK